MKNHIISQIENIKEDLYKFSMSIFEDKIDDENVLDFCVHLCKTHNISYSTKVIKDHTFLISKSKEVSKGPVIALLYYYSFKENIIKKWQWSMASPMVIGSMLGVNSVIEKYDANIISIGMPSQGLEILVEENLINNFDYAILMGAGELTRESGCSMSVKNIEVQYRSCPIEGTSYIKYSNPIDALIQTFLSINLLQKSLPSHAFIRGVISNGGTNPELIPDKTEAKFLISSSNEHLTEEITYKIKDCIKGVQLQTKAKADIFEKDYLVKGFITNTILNRLFCHNLKEVGIIDIHNAQCTNLSLKAGKISNIAPTIFPIVGINIPPQKDIRKRLGTGNLSLEAKDAILKGAKASALTIFDILNDNKLQKNIKHEFKNTIRKLDNIN